MERTEVNVQTGEVTVIQFTVEEEAAALTYAASLPAPASPAKPTLAELQAELAVISAQIAALGAAS
jgi:hypothetical protein